jgi:protein-tyrosine phosphatase
MAESPAVLDDAHRFAAAAPEEEYVHGACAPGWHSVGDRETVVSAWIAAMEAQGIERVVSLVAGRQVDATGATVARYRDAFGWESVLHAPVPDHRLASPETLRDEVLPFLEASVGREDPVVVHCLAGIGRTGQVLAAWLVHGRGYDPEAAVDAVTEAGRDPTEAVREGRATEDALLALLDRFA